MSDHMASLFRPIVAGRAAGPRVRNAAKDVA